MKTKSTKRQQGFRDALQRLTMTLMLVMLTAATAWAGSKPVGCLDACTGGEKLIHIQGWAYDPDYPAQSLPLYVYIYTDEACTKSYDVNYNHSADVPRPDVNEAKGITGNHGFNFDIPIADAGTYWVKIFTISINQDGNLQIGPIMKVTVTAPVMVTIGEERTMSSIRPFVMYAYYSLTEQIYTAEEIGMDGTITSIAFNYASSTAFSMGGVQVYLKHTDKNKFDSDTDMVPVGAEDKVFEGTFSATGAGWVTIELDTPFEYDGNSNLLVCCFDPTNGSFGNYYKFYCSDISEDYRCHFAFSDYVVPSLEVSNTANSFRAYDRSMIRFNIYSGTFSKS